MNSRTIPLAACVLLLVAGPLFAQGSDNPAANPGPVAAPAATHVTGSVVGVGDRYLQITVDRVLDAPADVAAALAGKTITLTVDPATVKPAALNPTDHVELWFKDVLSAHLATRVVLAPPAAPAAPAAASADITAPAGPAAAHGGSAAASNAPAPAGAPGPGATGGTAPQPGASSAEEGAAASETARPLAAGKLPVEPESGGDWVLLGAAGLVALMALVALRLTVRAKPLATGLHLGHERDLR